MKQALLTLQLEQDAGLRAEAEKQVISMAPEDLCAYIFNSGESVSTRLIACSALALQQQLSIDATKHIITQMCLLERTSSIAPLISKLAQVVAMNLVKMFNLIQMELQELVFGLNTYFDVYAPILEELLLNVLALHCKANIKPIAALSASIFAAISKLPIHQLSPYQGLQMVTLLKAATGALPNDPSLFGFIFTDATFSPSFMNMFLQQEITCDVADLVTTLLTVKLPKNSSSALVYLGPPLLYLITNGPRFYSCFTYNQLKAVTMCFTTIYTTHNNILRPNKDFVLSALNNIFCVFAQHPSHFIFDLMLPSLINIFNDLSLRSYDIPTSLTMYLIERTCFYVNRHNLRSLLSVTDGDTLTESEEYLAQDSIDSNTSFWLTWFAAFKGNCMSLVGKLAIFYPHITLKTLTQNLSQFLTSLAEFENSMTLEQAQQFTRHTEHYNAMDSVIAIVDASVYSVLRHLLFTNTYRDLLKSSDILGIAQVLLSYNPIHPIIYYRIMAILENLYKDFMCSISGTTGDVVVKPLKGKKKQAQGQHPSSAEQGKNSLENESGTSVKNIIAEYIAPLLQPIFQLYLQMIVFKSQVLGETGIFGEELYSKLSQDTLAIRRLAADRAKTLASNRYLLKEYVIPSADVFASFAGHVALLQQQNQVTAYEYVLLNQIIACAMLAHNDSEGFQRIVADTLQQSRNVLFSPEITSVLSSPDAFVSYFGLDNISVSNPVSLTTPTPLSSLLLRRKVMFAIQQAKEVLNRIHDASGTTATQSDLIDRLKDIIRMLLVIASRGFLAATPKYFEQQLSNQRVLLGGTISGGVAKVDLECHDATATDIEHAHSWLERCLISSLQCIALNQQDLLQYLLQLDYDTIPIYVLRLILFVVPRLCDVQVILILSKIVSMQYYDIHAIYTMLTEDEHKLLSAFLPRIRETCVLSRTAESMLWEDLREKKEVLARNILNLCNRAVMDICVKLFLQDGDINERIQAVLSTNQQFVDYSLSLLFNLLVSFSSDAKYAAQIAILICKVFDYISSWPPTGSGKQNQYSSSEEGIRSDGVAKLASDGPMTPPITPILTTINKAPDELLHKIAVFSFAFILQYSQYDSYLSCFCVLAGRSIQLAEDQLPIEVFYSGHEHIVPGLIAELKNTPFNNSKHIRQTILNSLKQAKRIQPNTQVPTNITIAALMTQRAEINDSMEVNIGDYTIGEMLGDTFSAE